MKAIFISDTNLRRGGVYGLRVASLARAMARRGHQIVVLSPTCNPGDGETRTGEVASLLAHHDWREPFFMERLPRAGAWLAALRANRAPPLLRRLLTGALIAGEGGVHGDWSDGARPLLGELAARFKPDVVWTNFGNSSNLVVGQELARLAGSAWTIDFKDNWANYIPPALRAWLAFRLRDAAGFTSNAHLHADIAARWFKQPHEVVYSGVAQEMIAPPGSLPDADKFLIMLVGSTYDSAKLGEFLSGLRQWLNALSAADLAQVEFHYAGADHAALQAALDAAPLACATRLDANIDHASLARLCHAAALNCYIWAHFGFHHKLLELMACRRPVICFPGEHEESIELAAEVQGDLWPCRDPAKLHAAFQRGFAHWQARRPSSVNIDVSALTWDAGASRLEAFLFASIERASSKK